MASLRASLRRSERGERGSLEDGRSVGTDRLADVDVETVVRRMVGRDASAFFARAPVEIGDTQFEVRGVSRRRVVSDVSFGVRRGEIFGIGGMRTGRPPDRCARPRLERRGLSRRWVPSGRLPIRWGMARTRRRTTR